jgi:hypothetical protein
MKPTVRCLLACGTLLVIVAPARAALDPSDAVVQIWQCEMNESTTEQQVEEIAEAWLKAVKAMPGGAAAEVKVFFPVVVNNTGQIDLYIVLSLPSFTDWGKFWDAFDDDSPAGKAEDLIQGKIECPDSMLWESVGIAAD